MPETVPRQGQDFIVSELISELKSENARKDTQSRKLMKALYIVVVAAFCALLLTVGGFLLYLNQYDYSGTTTSTVTTDTNATGVYTIIDSYGNVISADLTSEEVAGLLKEVNNGNGESSTNEHSIKDTNEDKE